MSEPLPRAQAIATGALVELSHFDHWKWPVACTVALWRVINDAVMRYGYTHGDILLDIQVQLLRAAQEQPVNHVLYFDVSLGRCVYRLKAVAGPDDTVPHVITLMLAED